MKNWYKQAGPDLSAGESQYTAVAKVQTIESAADNSWDAEIDESITFKYNIELEYRSWGIKEINVSFRDVVNVYANITYFDANGNEVKRDGRSIPLDMSKLKIENVPGDGVYVASVDISLTNNMEIDYNNSSVTVVRGGRA